MQSIFPGYNTSAFAPMGATYTDWLQSQVAPTSPIAQAYAQSFAPWAQLQYLASGAVPGNIDATGNPYAGNPFGSFLQGGASLAPDWTGLATNVLGALGADPASATETQLRLQERFGTGDQATERQRQLAQAPIVTQSPFALRGETQNILNRLYNDWMVNQPATAAGEDPTGYLQHAMNNLWGRFGVV